jgi:ABC-type multidrug transport system ATPase subunit
MQIDLTDIGKSYDGAAWAVSGLTFSIPSGAIFGLVGPNGAGKSTTLRLLATVVRPSAGQILFDGAALPADPSELRRQIGFLGDGNPLYRHMTPAEYLRFFGQCYRLPGRQLESAIEHTLETFGLDVRRDTPASEMSKGMRQRLAIARTLVHRPELLLLDEPADGLDPLARRQLREILRQVAADGVAIVISSHILRELDASATASRSSSAAASSSPAASTRSSAATRSAASSSACGSSAASIARSSTSRANACSSRRPAKRTACPPSPSNSKALKRRWPTCSRV